MYIFEKSKITELREAHSLTLPELGKRLGKPQLAALWEAGVYSPSIDNLLLLCNEFHVSPMYFFKKERG